MRTLAILGFALTAALPAIGQEVRIPVSGWTAEDSDPVLSRFLEWPEVVSVGTREGRIRFVRKAGRELSLARIEELLRVLEAGRVDREAIELEGDVVLVFEGLWTPADVAFLVEGLGSFEGVDAMALEQPGRIRVSVAGDPVRPVRLGDLLARVRARPAGGRAVRFVLIDAVWTEPRLLGEGP